MILTSPTVSVGGSLPLFQPDPPLSTQASGHCQQLKEAYSDGMGASFAVDDHARNRISDLHQNKKCFSLQVENSGCQTPPAGSQSEMETWYR